MIITIQGTKYGSNGAAKLAGALSFIGVMKDQRGSLILQFMDKTRHNVESYLIGASLRNESFVQDTSMTDISAGMDALFAHSGGQLSKALFNETTRKLTASNMKNFYDIAFSTNKESFEKELLEKNRKSKDEDHDFIESFLKAASSAYKDVYVVVDSKNKQLSDQITRWSEVNLIMVPQGRREPFVKGPGRNMAVVNDYCSGSAFNAKSLMKEYESKIIYALMHNVFFNDACADGTLLAFLQQNLNARPGDVNYEFMHNLEILYDSVVRNTKRKVEDIDPDRTVYSYKGQKFIDMPWSDIDEGVLAHIVNSEDYVPLEPLAAVDDETEDLSNTETSINMNGTVYVDGGNDETDNTGKEDEIFEDNIDDANKVKEERPMKKRGGLFAAFSRKPKTREIPADIPEEDDWETPVDERNEDDVDENNDNDIDINDIELIEIPQDISDLEPEGEVKIEQDVPPVAIRPEPGQDVISELPEIEIPEDEIENDLPEIEMVKTEIQEPVEIPDIPEMSMENPADIAENAKTSDEEAKEDMTQAISKDIQEDAEGTQEKDVTPSYEDVPVAMPEEDKDAESSTEDTQPHTISEEERLAMLMPETKVKAEENINPSVKSEPEAPSPAPVPAAKPMTEEERLNALLKGL